MKYGTSSSEDRKFSEFIGEMIDLSQVLDYIGSKLMPHQVFSEEALETWARENDFVHINDKP